ncbi:MAG: hypothetical protein HQK82_06205, partial [Desulfovibrionaceae bacterium]|nr:hypothetical protein [Desulfovibrionaceae bacterium]
GNPAYGGDWILEMGNVDLAARYFAAGKLDNFKGVLHDQESLDLNGVGAGTVIADVYPNDSAAVPFCMAVEYIGGTEYIVVAGSLYDGSCWSPYVERFNADGSWDSNFNSGQGWESINLNGVGNGQFPASVGDAQVNAVAVDACGDIFIAGYVVDATVSSPNFNHKDFLVVKLGSDGTVNAEAANYFIAGQDNVATSLAIQPADGKIVVAGYASNGSNDEFAVARYTPSLALDSGFNGANGGGSGGVGYALYDFGAEAKAYAVVLQDVGDVDLRIVLGGFANNGVDLGSGGENKFALVRFHDDGRLDVYQNMSHQGFGFETSGWEETSFGYDAGIKALAVDANGFIVAGGYAKTASGDLYQFALARYDLSGIPDQNFGSDNSNPGTVTTGLTGNDVSINSIAIDSIGRIVAAGTASDGTNSYYAAARYSASGSLDVTFGTTGSGVQLFCGTTGDTTGGADSVTVLQSGNILVSGHVIDSHTSYWAIGLNQLDRNGTFAGVTGSLDSNGNGTGVLIDYFGVANGSAFYSAVDANHDLVVAGTTIIGSATDIVLARYDANGVLDTSFGVGGTEYVDVTKISSSFSTVSVNGLAIDTAGDGGIFVAGMVMSGSDMDFMVASFTSSGSASAFITNRFNGDDCGATGIAVESDGKPVVAGWIYNPGSGNNQIVVARYTTALSLDPAFNYVSAGQFGYATGDYFNGLAQAQAVAIQSDQKIVVAGCAAGADYNNFALIRFTSGGAVDRMITTDFAGDSAIYALAVQPDQSIVAGGTAKPGGSDFYQFALARYDSDLNLERYTAMSVGNGDARINALAIDASGRIVAAGGFSPFSMNYTDIALARYTAYGSLDTTFGDSGIITVQPFKTQRNNTAWSVAVQNDGKILAVGNAADGQGVDSLGILRFDVNGATATFGATGGLNSNGDGTGALLYNFGDSHAASPFHMALDASQDIVIAGTVTVNSVQEVLLARYDSDGVLDASFGAYGMEFVDVSPLTPDFGSSYPFSAPLVNALAIDANSGNIYIAGSVHDGNANSGAGATDFLLMQFSSGGAYQAYAASNFDGVTDWTATSLAIQPADGKIVVAGYDDNGSSYRNFAVARYTTSLGLDPGFNGANGGGSGGPGYATGDYFLASAQANAVTLQTVSGDLKIVLGGGAMTGGENDVSQFALVRLNSDGSFGHNVLTSFDGDAAITSLVTQTADQYVVAGGYATTFTQMNYGEGGVISTPHVEFALARYDKIGLSLDNAFGSNGTVVSSIGGEDAQISSIAIASDGSGDILAAGTTASKQIALARYTAAGVLDPSFGTGGVVLTAPSSPSSWDSLGAGTVAFLNGKILVAGFAADHVSGDNYLTLTRFGANGPSPATTSSGGLNSNGDGTGALLFDYGGQVASSSHFYMALEGNDIVVAGTVIVGGDQDVALARYDGYGVLDTNFGKDGIELVDVGALNAYLSAPVVNALAIDTGQTTNIYIAGSVYDASVASGFGGSDFLVMQFTANGVYKAYAASNFDNNSNWTATSLAIQPGDGKIVVAGYVADQSANNQFVLARYLPATGAAAALSLDTSSTANTPFNNGAGYVTYDFPGTSSQANAVVILSDNTIVAAGSAHNAGYDSFALVHFNAGGSQVLYTASTDFGGDAAIYALTTQTLGGAEYILAGGEASPNGDYQFALARYHEADLSRDASFNPGSSVGQTVTFYHGGLSGSDPYTGGTELTTVGGGDAFVNALAIDGSGRILAAGSTAAGEFAVARYTSGGVLDAGFGIGGVELPSLPAGSTAEQYGGAYSVGLVNGKILLAGDVRSVATGDVCLGLIRLGSPSSDDLSLSGGVAGQAVNDNATTFTPFGNANAGSHLTITDSASSSGTVTITLCNFANGVLTPGSGFTVMGDDYYNIATGDYFAYNPSTGVGTLIYNSVASANLELQGLIFTPTNHQAATGQTVTTSFTVSVHDGLGVVQSDTTTSVTVKAVNLQPAPSIICDANHTVAGPVLPADTGASVSGLLSGVISQTSGNYSLGGIAITGNAANAATQGVWQYFSNDSGTWVDINSAGVPTSTNAVMISASAMMRFSPVAGFSGTAPQLTFEVVDGAYPAGSYSDGIRTDNPASSPNSASFSSTQYKLAVSVTGQTNTLALHGNLGGDANTNSGSNIASTATSNPITNPITTPLTIPNTPAAPVTIPSNNTVAPAINNASTAATTTTNFQAPNTTSFSSVSPGLSSSSASTSLSSQSGMTGLSDTTSLSSTSTTASAPAMSLNSLMESSQSAFNATFSSTPAATPGQPLATGMESSLSTFASTALASTLPAQSTAALSVSLAPTAEGPASSLSAPLAPAPTTAASSVSALSPTPGAAATAVLTPVGEATSQLMAAQDKAISTQSIAGTAKALGGGDRAQEAKVTQAMTA